MDVRQMKKQLEMFKSFQNILPEMEKLVNGMDTQGDMVQVSEIQNQANALVDSIPEDIGIPPSNIMSSSQRKNLDYEDLLFELSLRFFQTYYSDEQVKVMGHSPASFEVKAHPSVLSSHSNPVPPLRYEVTGSSEDGVSVLDLASGNKETSISYAFNTIMSMMDKNYLTLN